METKLQKFLNETMEFAAVLAVHQGELPSAKMGRILINLETTILPQAVIAGFKAALETQDLIAKSNETKTPSWEDVVARATQLSKTAADFAGDFATVQKDQVLEATKKTLQLKTILNERDISMEGIMQHFDIPVNTTQVVDTQQQTQKDQKIGM